MSAGLGPSPCRRPATPSAAPTSLVPATREALDSRAAHGEIVGPHEPAAGVLKEGTVTIADDYALIHAFSSWSNEVREFEELLRHRERRGARDLAAAGAAVLGILPPTPPFAPYRVAVEHLLAVCGVPRPSTSPPESEGSRRNPTAA
jgi:hypothetical protein